MIHGCPAGPIAGRDGVDQQPAEGDPTWQQAVVNEQTQALQFCGFKLKLSHDPLRQTWLTTPRPDWVTQRHCPSGTPAHDEPPLPVPMCPARQSAQLEHVSGLVHVPSPHTGPHVGQVGPQSVNVPQVQPDVHVRDRVCVPPHVPGHARVSGVSMVPGEHSPSSTHIDGPHLQSVRQRRS